VEVAVHGTRPLVGCLAAALSVALLVAPGARAADDVTSVATFAGDPTGAGPALSLSVSPFGLLERESDVLIAAGDVVRRL
jgi:hypothetical protein